MANVLLLSAGRRIELIQAFQKAMATHAPGSIIIAADAQPLAPALYFADKSALIPRVTESSYVDELCKVIDAFGIDLVVPTIDPELPILADAREDIESRTNARVMIAEPWIIRICNDKLLTQEHVISNNLLAPRIFESIEDISEDDFPVIMKPRAGSSSIGVNVVNSFDEINYLFPRTNEPMIQELITGEEYTVDCFSDFEGNVISVVPRLRIATRGGEILKGRITKNRNVIEAVRQLLATLPMPGHSTVQCFETAHGIEFIEVNPRFGGGAPMSIAAGADSCSRLLKILQGEKLSYDESYEDELTFLRFDQSIAIRESDLVEGVGRG